MNEGPVMSVLSVTRPLPDSPRYTPVITMPDSTAIETESDTAIRAGVCYIFGVLFQFFTSFR